MRLSTWIWLRILALTMARASGSFAVSSVAYEAWASKRAAFPVAAVLTSWP